jgi:hypothetical protein
MIIIPPRLAALDMKGAFIHLKYMKAPFMAGSPGALGRRFSPEGRAPGGSIHHADVLAHKGKALSQQD